MDKVYVVDSLNATAGERVLALYAKRLIDKGLDIKDIVEKLNSVKSKIKLLAIVDTLEYLKKVVE